MAESIWETVYSCATESTEVLLLVLHKQKHNTIHNNYTAWENNYRESKVTQHIDNNT